MEWVTCYESAIEGDARTVLAMLEGRGIPCRLEPLGSSVYPQMGFAVHVPVDRLEEARELIESEEPSDEPAPAPEPEVVTPAPAIVATYPRAIDLARRALHVVRVHPTVLLVALVGAATQTVIQSIAALPGPGLQKLRDHAGALLMILAVDTISFGVAMAFVDGALDGRPSWRDALRRLTAPRLARLFGSGLVLSAPFYVPYWSGWGLPEDRSPQMLALVVAAVAYAYVLFRSAFIPIALIVDGTDVPEAFRRSWAVVGRSWRTVIGLGVLGAIVTMPFAMVTPIDTVVVGPVVTAVQLVAYLLLYRALTGRPTASSDTR